MKMRSLNILTLENQDEFARKTGARYELRHRIINKHDAVREREAVKSDEIGEAKVSQIRKAFVRWVKKLSFHQSGSRELCKDFKR